MKKQLLIAAKASVRRLWTMAALLGVVILAPACDDDDPNAERSETIRVYDELGGEAVDMIYVDVRGGQSVIYVQANVDYQVAWQDAASSPWVKILERRPSTTPGVDEIMLEIKPRETFSFYTRRTGMLLLSSPQNKLGKFVSVYQGAVARIYQDFKWLNYGSADPLMPGEERPIGGWTSVQKEYGWTSKMPDYCFGKNGYAKLGDDQRHKGDLITPFVNEMRDDSLLMVSFRAAAYTDADGNTDSYKLTVNVLGGGVFSDTGLTTREVTISSYEVFDGALAGSMWTRASYLLFVIGTELNPITSNTQIQFVSGGAGESADKNSRVFLDNVYIYTLNQYNDNLIDLNKDSDRDVILGDKVE